MTPRNPKLHAALKAYTMAALRLAALRLKDLHPEDFFHQADFLRWMPTGRGRQKGQPWHAVLILIEAEMHALPEYDVLHAALAEDAVIAAQIEKPIGDGELSSTLSLRQLTDGVLFDLPFTRLGSGPPTDGAVDADIDALYSRMESDLYSEHIMVEVIAPLYDFSITAEQVELDHELSVVRFHQGNIAHLPISLPGGRWNGPEAAIAVRYQTPKLVGERIDSGIANARSRHEQAVKKIERTVCALSVFKSGPVKPYGVIIHSPNVLGTASMYGGVFSGAFVPPSSRYTLSVHDAPKFVELCRTLMSSVVLRFSNLDVALRRFADSAGRSDVNDRLVDLVIAAEAILLADDSKYRGELRNRFAINAMLARRQQAPAEWTFYFFREAYDLRSGIVHGSTRALSPNPRGHGKMSMLEFTNLFEAEFRKVLAAAIERAKEPSTPVKELFPWTDMLLDVVSSAPRATRRDE